VSAWAGTITEDPNGGQAAEIDQATGFVVQVTWRREDVPTAQVTTTYAVIEEVDVDRRVRYAVSQQMEFLVGTDPEDLDGTEEFSEHFYEGGSSSTYAVESAAREEARRLAQSELATAPVTWDGQPDTVNAV
jgi:hypothetical protein